MSVVDLVACAGMPTQKMITRKDFFLLEWDPKTTNNGGSTSVKSSTSITLPLGTSFTWAPSASSCHMQVTVNRDGTVYDVDFSSSDAVKDMDGGCAQLVKQCVFHQSDTSLDKDYDAFQYFFPETATPAKTGKP